MWQCGICDSASMWLAVWVRGRLLPSLPVDLVLQQYRRVARCLGYTRCRILVASWPSRPLALKEAALGPFGLSQVAAPPPGRSHAAQGARQSLHPCWRVAGASRRLACRSRGGRSLEAWGSSRGFGRSRRAPRAPPPPGKPPPSGPAPPPPGGPPPPRPRISPPRPRFC